MNQVRKLRVRAMGVDRAGNLWAWSPGPAAVDLISPSGAKVARYSVAGAHAVDVDSEFGLAGLARDGSLLQWFSRDGNLAGSVHLEGPATSVRWIGESRVALTPQMAAHRIEVWDLKSRQRVQTFGKETALRPGIGATRLRGVLLEYDWQRRLLYSLETFTGELQVWKTDGEGQLAWTGQIENPDRKTVEDWLVQVDQKAKAEQDIQTPVVMSFWPALSPDGDLWVGLSSSLERREATLVKTAPGGIKTVVVQDEACPSRNFVFWGSQLLFYRDPPRPSPCLGTRRFP